jgi:hypothetical protein
VDPMPPATPEAFFAAHPLGLAVHRWMLDVLEALAGMDAGDPPVEIGIRVTGSQVSYRRRRALAWTWLPGRWLRMPTAEVVLSISLPREDPSPRWKQVAHPTPRAWMHHLEIGSESDLDDDVAGWLAEAWAAAG